MQKKNKTPPQWVVAQIGGIRPTARAIKRTPAAVLFWLRRGTVPTSVMQAILEYAKENSLDITSDDLIYGR